jgi:hypothetical protein
MKSQNALSASYVGEVRTTYAAVPLHAMEVLGGEEIELLLILEIGTRWG